MRELYLTGARACRCWRMSISKLAHELRLAGARACRCSRTSISKLARELRLAICRKLFRNISLQKKKLLSRRHWTGNEVETSEALEVAGICTNKGRLSFEAAMLL